MIVTTVLFLFPPELPTTAANMNYCVVAFGIVLIISVIQWFVDGRKNFKGPQIEIDDSVLVAAKSHDPAARDGDPEMAMSGKTSATDIIGNRRKSAEEIADERMQLRV